MQGIFCYRKYSMYHRIYTRTTSFSEAYLIFVSIKVWGKIVHQKNTNLVKFDLKEAIFQIFSTESELSNQNSSKSDETFVIVPPINIFHRSLYSRDTCI